MISCLTSLESCALVPRICVASAFDTCSFRELFVDVAVLDAVVDERVFRFSRVSPLSCGDV